MLVAVLNIFACSLSGAAVEEQLTEPSGAVVRYLGCCTCAVSDSKPGPCGFAESSCQSL
jgi:hypothetical protein